MTTPLTGRRRARTLFVGAAAALATGLAAAPANAGVTLDWTAANVFDLRRPGNVDHTWLGYVTSPTIRTNGTVSPSAGATGPTVTVDSPRGATALNTWQFPAVRGTVNETTLAGDMQFEGTLSFSSPAPPAGHGFNVTVEDPRIELDGAGGGAIYASGTSSAAVPYDASLPIFTLDASDVSSTLTADGTRVLGGFEPAIVNAGRVFPASGMTGYPDGAGPDRTPNTFGSFSIAVSPNTGPKGDKGDKGDAGAKGDTGATGPQGATGPAGRNGTNGTNGRNGTTTTVRIQTSALATAPFRGKAARKVRVTARKSTRTLATGTVKGKTLTITLARGVRKKQLKGRYVLRLTGRSRGSAVVRLP